MNILSKILILVKLHQKDIFLGLCVLLIAVIGFNLGRINALQKTPIKITGETNVYQATIVNSTSNNTKTSPTQPRDPRVVASKASTTKKYHFTWCSGAKSIKETNKIWFETEALAQQAGYTLAGNCVK